MIVKTDPQLFSESTKLWRYISFSKFVSLLHTQKLHFTRADRFIDTFESSIPVRDIEAARSYYASLLQSEIVNVGGVSQFPRSDIRKNLQHFLKLSEAEVNAIKEEELPRYLLKTSNRYQYVNCWHTNENESAGMWQIYMNVNEGVAVQSTPEALATCLEPDQNTIYLGPVKYLDYAADSWGEPHPLHPIFHKRSSFAHEREVRAVVINPIGVDPRHSTGVLLPVDLKKLIQQVYVSPNAEPWYRDTVYSVCERYGLPVTPVQSTLYEQPMF